MAHLGFRTASATESGRDLFGPRSAGSWPFDPLGERARWLMPDMFVSLTGAGKTAFANAIRIGGYPFKDGLSVHDAKSALTGGAETGCPMTSRSGRGHSR